MAIRKDKRLSPLKNKASKKREEEDKPDLSYEAGVDPQKDQINEVPKNTEDWQNANDEDKLGEKNKS
ncbi:MULTISPECIES: hypothetical protein [Olivibacter]|jgi:hypothetical protein|uniref:Uncharacterized protein n=3 Tax=Sphingobacteriaceae TaxID=84566 RepID=F4C7B2_SPHS2|nr:MULTISPECIES: hypothetical protein [Olivibacter]MDM8175550.1 hypothetical protein [Olivibacter sp. 47]MDX3914159.1 hypothetical protein [Pseudosphingobacterium sp.]QEL02296.1 hypothetical protein FKG96_16260 [Olivibacter sp. LS-1]